MGESEPERAHSGRGGGVPNTETSMLPWDGQTDRERLEPLKCNPGGK